MTKLKHVFAISFLGIAMVSAPLVGLAHDNAGRDDNYKAKVGVEQKAEFKAERKALKAELKADLKASRGSSENNSIFSRIFRLFNSRANAVVEIRASLTPSISGITAPTVLRTGAEGTWTVKASDPKNGALSYAVDWGESSKLMSIFSKEEPVFVQTSTFTHAYANPGVYTVKFMVKNSAGLSASSSVFPAASQRREEKMTLKAGKTSVSFN